MYRLGWPGARMLGRMGVPLVVHVLVERDAEAEVFIATSQDVPGLVVEAESLDELDREVKRLTPLLLESQGAKKRASAVSYTQPICA